MNRWEPACWTYDVELDLRVDGDAVKYRVDNGGAHFRTSASTHATRYRWLNGRWTDVAASQPSSVPAALTGVKGACDLISATDVTSVMNHPYKQSQDLRPVAASSEAGFPLQASNCVYEADDRSTVQVGLTDAMTEENGRKEFDIELGHDDPDGKAVDVVGQRDAKIASGDILVARRGSRVVMIFIGRRSNQVDPFDADKLTTLFKQLSSRL